MTDRQIQIVEAAMRLFARYGVRRTTMNDVALEAEVARQTVYNTFANKDEILRACVRLMTDRTCAAIKAGLKDCTSLEAKLDLAVHHLAVVPWDALASSNHAEDIIEGVNGASRGDFDVMYERYRKVLMIVFKPHAAELKAAGATASALADFVVTSADAAKHNARDRAHLLRLLATLTRVVSRMALDSKAT